MTRHRDASSSTLSWVRRGGGAWLALALVFPRLSAAVEPFDILLVPKIVVDRAIEARSMADIAKDNEIILKVNGLMAEVGTIKASTSIYEQRLLVTGLFDDKPTYDAFEQGVRAVKDVKKLYWHVIYMPKAEQERRKLLDWGDVVLLETKAEGRLIGTAGVADVNFRVAGDAFGTLYLLGRARSQPEHAKALARVRDGDTVKKVIDYADVRP
jgi:hyperosmotically inducible protein